MLDVHPPHHPTHTWKDFFIHIATIVVGLIIAVGLEQAVEALHHHHQREELREALLQDNLKALRDDRELERYALNRVQWLSARIDDLTVALHTRATAHDIPLLPVSFRSVPGDSNWEAAKSSNLAEVLPQEDITVFAEVDDIINSLLKNNGTYEYTYRREAFEQRFRVSPADVVLDFSTATREDLTQDLALLSEERANAVNTYDFTLYLDGCLTAVIRGERNLDRIDDEENSVEDEGVKHLDDGDPYRPAKQTLRTHSLTIPRHLNQ
jgi:hypothetical protein